MIRKALFPLAIALAACRGGDRREAPAVTTAAPSASISPPAEPLPSSSVSAAVSCPPACTGATRWSKRFPAEREGRVTGIAFGPKGEARVTGIFSGRMDLDEKRSLADTSKRDDWHDGFVASLGDDGSLSDPILLQGPRDQTPYVIAIDRRGNTILGGSFYKDIEIGGATVVEDKPSLHDRGFVMALDPTGKPLYTHLLPGLALSVVKAIALDANDGVWIAGEEGGPTRWELWVEHLDASGKSTFLWHQDRGRGSDGSSIAVDSKGNAVVLGYAYVVMTLDGAPLFPAGPDVSFMVKLSPEGKLIWKKQLPAGGQHVVIDAQDRIWTTAAFGGSITWNGKQLASKDGDGLLLSWDADGNPLSARQFTTWQLSPRIDLDAKLYFKYRSTFSGNWENGTLLALDPAGNPLVVSTFQGTFTVDGQKLTTKHARDVVLFKLDKNDGKVLYARQVGGEAGQLAHGLAIDDKGRAFIGGAFIDKPHAWLTSIEP